MAEQLAVTQRFGNRRFDPSTRDYHHVMKDFLRENWHGFWYSFLPIVALLVLLELVAIEGCLRR